jgi:hypothetical protein
MGKETIYTGRRDPRFVTVRRGGATEVATTFVRRMGQRFAMWGGATEVATTFVRRMGQRFAMWGGATEVATTFVRHGGLRLAKRGGRGRKRQRAR